MSFKGKNVINGTYGSVWVDGEKINECFGLKATVEIQREDIKMCGNLWTASKMLGATGKGSIKLHKVSTRFEEKIFNAINTGEDTDFEIQSMLADPDALNKGKETVLLKGVQFDELTMQDFEAGAAGTVEIPFRFSGAEYLDKIV